jgi:hypothetical protein
VGRASTQKKVARAATTGGGRTVGERRPMGWYMITAAVIVFGIFLVAFSRNEELNKGQVAAEVAPKINSDSWNSSLSLYICDHWVPPIPLFETANGIDTISPGTVHIQPFTAQASGKHANLGLYVKAVPGGMKVSKSELRLPKLAGDTVAADVKDWKNGDHCPNGKAGQVKFTVNGKQLKIDPSTWDFRNGDTLDLGFVPDATTLPNNPNEKTNLTTAAAIQTTSPTATTVPATTATTVPATTATTAPAQTVQTLPVTPASTPLGSAPTPTAPATTAP